MSNEDLYIFFKTFYYVSDKIQESKSMQNVERLLLSLIVQINKHKAYEQRFKMTGVATENENVVHQVTVIIRYQNNL